MAEISVTFGAKTDDFKRGVDEAKEKLRELRLEAFLATKEMSGEAAKKGLKELPPEIKKVSDAFEGTTPRALALAGVFGTLLGAGLVKAFQLIVETVVTLGHEIKQLGEVSKTTGASLADLQAVMGLASKEGIGGESALKSLEEFQRKLYEASREGGKLAEFMKANGAAITDASGKLRPMTDLLGEANRLIFNAKTEFERIKIAETMGLTREWVEILNQSPAAFQAAMAESRALGGVIDEELVRKSKEFEQKWNETVASWTRMLRGAILQIKQELMTLIQAANMVKTMIDIAADGARVALGMAPFDTRSPGARMNEARGLNEDGSEKPRPLTIPGKGTGGTDTSTLYPRDKSGDAAAGEAARAAMLEIEGKIKAIEEGQRREQMLLDARGRMYQLSASERIAEEKALAESTVQQQLALMQQELEIENLKESQKQQIRNKMDQLRERQRTATLKLDLESIQEFARQLEGVLRTVTGAFTSQLRGLLQGTTSWAQAARNIFLDLTMKVVGYFEDMVVKWLVGEATKTAATTAGAVARTGAEQAAATTGMIPAFLAMVKSIIGSSATTFAGVTANLSPVMGPLAVGPAAATAATVAGMASMVPALAVGAWNLEGDMRADLHRGEMVVPANFASGIRSLLSGGAPGGRGQSGDTHLHVNALDGASVHRFMRQNRKEIARDIAREQSRSRSARPTY